MKMYEPWVGTKWNQTGNAVGGRRLLILGESHYGNPDHPEDVGTCDPGMTKRVIEHQALSGPRSYRFFTNLLQVVAGKLKASMRPEEIGDVWNSVAFYNYVPVLAATTSRKAPSDAMFEQGRKPLLRVVEKLEPEAIIVCGYRLWGPMYNGLPPELQDDAKGQPFRRVGPAIAARMKHPSAAFNALAQHEAVTKELFRRVDEARIHTTS